MDGQILFLQLLGNCNLRYAFSLQYTSACSSIMWRILWEHCIVELAVVCATEAATSLQLQILVALSLHIGKFSYTWGIRNWVSLHQLGRLNCNLSHYRYFHSSAGCAVQNAEWIWSRDTAWTIELQCGKVGDGRLACYWKGWPHLQLLNS